MYAPVSSVMMLTEPLEVLSRLNPGSDISRI